LADTWSRRRIETRSDSPESLFGAGEFPARDAIHIAVMERRSGATIMTFDSACAACPGIACLPG